MRTETFEKELQNLSLLVGSWNADELFCSCYQDLLNKVKAGDGHEQKVEQAGRMRKLLMHQTEWMMNQWLSAKRNGNM